ncbi:Glycosyltransferase involved in cell wall bisynthesis [Solimonas aquatica]|uniref:Glycosyltransferase involved in cell wall bisynthesis n=1 Tax=Solimonas aquatica TaxID=489703 RepID=A0A1H9CNC9_9GAMM|nr:glycosyltransferase family 4 protein [Solimonas aquatica]SEQ02173.1 Glycosyltransferase involved in cell wall bisynthesis [Solimonas aquatica]
MKIVVVMHSHKLGGAERHVLKLLDALRARGHLVHFAGPHNGWLGEQVLARNIPSLHLPMRGMYDALSAVKLARYLRKVDADIVHGHSMRGTRYATWAGHRVGVPAVGTAHSTTAGRWLADTQALIPVSWAVHLSLRQQGYGRSLVDPIYPGIADSGVLTLSQRRESRAALGLKDEDCALVMLARLIPDKAQDLAIAALSRLRDLPLQLFLYGDGDADWQEQLKAQIEREQLQSRVRFLGQQQEASKTLAMFDIFLQPSRREALGLSLLEASAQALPIVASEVGGIPEVIEHEYNGLLVPANDAEALAAAIRRLHADPAWAAGLGAAARRRFLQEFTVNVMAARIEAVYKRALHPSHPAALSPASRPH